MTHASLLLLLHFASFVDLRWSPLSNPEGPRHYVTHHFGNMTTFTSVEDYWNFARSVQSHWRYHRDKVQAEFLASLIATSGSRWETIPAGSLMFRAQLGCEWPETAEEEAKDPGPRPFRPDRMMPLRYRANEGRVNPRGIPCLYAATVEETACAEVRPWIGAHVSVAQIKVRRDLQVINCTSEDQRQMIYLEEPDPAEREHAVWSDVDRAFARPVDRSDHTADYAPTQVIAEAFRERGLDGIGYRSSLGPGYNVAIFDLDAVAVINCTVQHVKSLKFEFAEAANRYFVTMDYHKAGGSDV